MTKHLKQPVSMGLALMIGAGMVSSTLLGAEAKKKAPKPYPLDTCVVSGEKLGSMGDPVVLEQNGQEVKFCCKACIKDFQAAPAKFMAKIEAANKKVKPYPLKTCVVSGEELGGMGDAYVFVHQGQEIKLCCKGCLKDFQKEPAKFLKKLGAAK